MTKTVITLSIEWADKDYLDANGGPSAWVRAKIAQERAENSDNSKFAQALKDQEAQLAAQAATEQQMKAEAFIKKKIPSLEGYETWHLALSDETYNNLLPLSRALKDLLGITQKTAMHLIYLYKVEGVCYWEGELGIGLPGLEKLWAAAGITVK